MSDLDSDLALFEGAGANVVALATADGLLLVDGATVMAHENTKLWLGGDFFVDWEDRHYAPHPAGRRRDRQAMR